jgi:lysophospholipase L1-like esterase
MRWLVLTWGALVAAGAVQAQTPIAPPSSPPAVTSPVSAPAEPCQQNLWPKRTAPTAETVMGDAAFSPELMNTLRSPAGRAPGIAKRRNQAISDWAGLCQYRADDLTVEAAGKSPDLVMMGDSLTENWVFGDPGLFNDRVIGRGIAGQVTGQMLVRFQQDVIALHPKTVHILGGTNDLSGVWGASRLEDIQGNIASMVDIARAHGIRVLVGSLTPALGMAWAPEVRPAPGIVAMNTWLKAYTRANGLTYVDYYSALAGPDGGMKPGLSTDGVHPNRRAYALMRKALEAALAGQ